jgi:hypothetical protein
MNVLCYLLGLCPPTERDCKTDDWQRVPTTQAGGGRGFPHIMKVLSLSGGNQKKFRTDLTHIQTTNTLNDIWCLVSRLSHPSNHVRVYKYSETC